MIKFLELLAEIALAEGKGQAVLESYERGDTVSMHTSLLHPIHNSNEDLRYRHDPLL